MFLKILFCLAIIGFVCVPSTAQQNSPATAQQQRLFWKPVKWAFPAPGLVTSEFEGETVYHLAPEVLGTRETKEDSESAMIFLSSKIVAAVVLLNAQEPAKVPEVERFLTTIAVEKAVDTPKDYTNQYLGSGMVNGSLVYFYRTHSGANVGASVSQDRRRVLVVPAPSEP